MSLLTKNRDKAEKIISEIEFRLRNRETFSRASVTDRFDAFSVNGYLTVVPNYIYIRVDVNESDLDDLQKIVEEFVAEWCKCDDKDHVRSFQNYVKDGELFGWN